MVPGVFPPAPGVPVFSRLPHRYEEEGRSGAARAHGRGRTDTLPITNRALFRLSFTGIFLCNFHRPVSKFPGAVFFHSVTFAQCRFTGDMLRFNTACRPPSEFVLLAIRTAPLISLPAEPFFAEPLPAQTDTCPLASLLRGQLYLSMVPRTFRSILSSVLRFIHISASSTASRACSFSLHAYSPA